MDPKILREAALAYEAVYNQEMRQEIEEQQDFENWVNSLVEEGYDLSEYTWEEMYEEYLSEGGAGPRATTAGPTMYGANDSRRSQSGPYQSRFARPRNANTGGYRGSRPGMSSLPSNYRGQELQAGARASASQVGTSRQGTAGTGAAPSAASRPSGGTAAARPSGGSSTTAARPSGGSSTTAARPAASAPTAKPAPSAGQTGDKTKDMQTWAKANPSLAAKVKPGQSGYGAVQQAKAATGGDAAAKSAGKLNTSAVTKTAFSSSTPALSKPLSTPSTSSTTTPTAAAKPTPTPVKKPMGSSKPGSLVSGFDLFDVVKGYLIDEGYAETEESAIAIMANMSEGWKLEIIDEAVKGEPSDRRRALAAERRKGIKPLPAKEGERYATYKIGQMAYTKRAKMGDDD